MLCQRLTLRESLQDDFFEEAMGLHKEGEEDGEGGPAQLKNQRVNGKGKERNKASGKGRGMGNKVRLRR